MGTVLSNSSSAAHVESKNHQFRNDCYLNDRASLTDLSGHLYPNPILNRSTSNDYGGANLLEVYSSRPALNGCIQNSTYQSSVLKPTPTTLITTPTVPSSTGLKRIIFPGLSKKAKSVNPVTTVRKAQHSQSGTATFSEQCEEPTVPVTPASPRRRTRGDLRLSNYSHRHEMRISGLDYSTVFSDTVHQGSQQDLSTLHLYADERRESVDPVARNATPYRKPYDSLKPICTACKHLSVSCYQPGAASASRNSDAFTGMNSQINASDSGQPSRHVHFNPRRQFSEPNTFVQRSHTQCLTRSELRSRVLLQGNSPPNSNLNCECLQDAYVETETRLHPSCQSVGRIHDFQRRASTHSTGKQVRKGVTHKHSPGNTQTTLIGSHALPRSGPTCLTNPRNESSPSHHREKKPYSFSQLSINAASPSRALGSPHPAIAYRVHSSVQPSPAYNLMPVLPPEEAQQNFVNSGECDRVHRRNTTVVEISPMLPTTEAKDAPQDVSWSKKSLTKSLSCYALRFFSQHHQANHLRSRMGGKSDANLPHSILPRPKGEKGRRKTSEKSQNKKQFGASIPSNSEGDKQHVDWDFESSGSTLCQNRPWYDQRSIVNPTKISNCTDTCQLFHETDRRASHTSQLSCHNPPKLYLPDSQGHKTEHRLHQYAIDPYCGLKLECDLTSQWMRKEDRSSQCRTKSVDLRQTVFKASTSELLRCLSSFIVARIQLTTLSSPTSRVRSNRLRLLQPSVIINWIRAVDRALLVQGWSELAFMNPANVVFVFMMLKDCLNCAVSSERELHTIVMACLYLSYSYMGNEISYPLKPFLIAETNQLLMENTNGNRKLFEGENALLNGFDSSVRTKVIDQVRNRFWQYCLRIINAKSQDMLHINSNSIRFTELFSELKSYDSLITPISVPVRLSSTPK